jgi:hypothetical protein
MDTFVLSSVLNEEDALQYIAQLDAGAARATQPPGTLVGDIHALLHSPTYPQLSVLVGHAGSGKSAFVWRCAREALRAYDSLLAAYASEHSEPSSSAPKLAEDTCPSAVLWVPVVLDLKQYAVTDLAGALPR